MQVQSYLYWWLTSVFLSLQSCLSNHSWTPISFLPTLARRRHLLRTVLTIHTYLMSLIYSSCQSVWIWKCTRPEVFELCLFFCRGRFRRSSPVWSSTGTPEQQHLIVPSALLRHHHPSLLIPSLSFLSLSQQQLQTVSLARSHKHTITHTRHLVLCVIMFSHDCRSVMPRWIASIITGGRFKFSVIINPWLSWLSSLGLNTGKGQLGHVCPLVAGRAPHSYCSLPEMPSIWHFNEWYMISSSFKFVFCS